MLSQKEIADHVTPAKLRKSPHGIECYFVKINKDWGMKLYYVKGTRDNAHYRQSRAAYHNIGPDVGDTFEFGEFYGYFTRIAKTFKCRGELEEDGLYEKYRDDLEDLRDALQAYDIMEGNDLHFGNVGIYNKQFVCIDFGDAMFPSEAAEEYGESIVDTLNGDDENWEEHNTLY